MRRCASKDVGRQRRLDWGVSRRVEKGTSANKDAGSLRGMNCEIPRRLERGTKHSL